MLRDIFKPEILNDLNDRDLNDRDLNDRNLWDLKMTLNDFDPS